MVNVTVRNYSELQSALMIFTRTHQETSVKFEGLRFRFYLTTQDDLFVVKYKQKIETFEHALGLACYMSETIHKEKTSK